MEKTAARYCELMKLAENVIIDEKEMKRELQLGVSQELVQSLLDCSSRDANLVQWPDLQAHQALQRMYGTHHGNLLRTSQRRGVVPVYETQ